jgi:hypothetical protein
MPIARERVAEHTPATTNISVAIQRAVNTTVEEAVFSMWFAYIHCWARDVFSIDSP